MIKKALHKISKKQLLVVGGDESHRKVFVDQIIQELNLDYFRFPKALTTIDDYIDFVRKEDLYKPWYKKKGKFNTNQILDFHRDWIDDNNSLIVLEELDGMELNWKIDLIKAYIEPIANRKKGEKTIRLIVTQEEENNILTEIEKELFYTEDNRTRQQIINNCIEVINLN
jgi:hypothetical protein